MRYLLPLFAAAAVTGAAAVMAQPASGWEIGPDIRGKNYSVNMPATLRESREGAQFDFPYPDRRAGHVHYVTRRTGSLEGARSMTIRYRIDAAPGTRIVPQQHPDRAATLSMFLQQRGDNWTARGPYESYRWYSKALFPVSPGTHEVTVDLKDDWKAVGSTTSDGNPAAFRRSLADADRVGFTFGSAGGRGHGVYATAPARFTLLDFEIR